MMNYVKKYALEPERVNQKSFYRKAYILIDDAGNEYLKSYDTIVMSRSANGELKRHWDGYSKATGKHVREFSGIGKKDWDAMEVVEVI